MAASATVDFRELIAPAFIPVWQKVKSPLREYTDFWLKGGRGSTKSSFISLAILMLMMKPQNRNVHAVCYKKVKETLRDTVYAQMEWAVDKLQAGHYFKISASPLKITYIPTRQTIYFLGLDRAEKTKGIKPKFGYIGISWFEELDHFDGMEEIRTALQSTQRGGDRFWTFYSYNPPATSANWVNKEALTKKAGRLVHSSTYRDIPEAWLSRQFLLEAEHLRATNERAYRHEYLGEVTGTGGTVFPNVRAYEITPEMIGSFDEIRQGIDWGFVTDPFVFLQLHYDRKHRSLYIFDEIYEHGLRNADAVPLVRDKAFEFLPIVADSSEEKSIKDFQYEGLNAVKSRKWPGSVEYGIKFLQGMDNIYIDPDRCPNAYREFSSYELEKEKDGTFRRNPPDRDNHTIDAARYALQYDMGRGTDTGGESF